MTKIDDHSVYTSRYYQKADDVSTGPAYAGLSGGDQCQHQVNSSLYHTYCTFLQQHLNHGQDLSPRNGVRQGNYQRTTLLGSEETHCARSVA